MAIFAVIHFYCVERDTKAQKSRKGHQLWGPQLSPILWPSAMLCVNLVHRALAL